MKTCTVCGAEWPDETKFCPNDGTTLRSTEGADLVGSIIGGNYHIEKKLGEGGMGSVYLGEHVKMGRKSAIKVMTQSMASDHDAIARFNREATNAARINHPNVCAIYDFGETPEGLIFLAMEFIEGEALSDMLTRVSMITPGRAAFILDQCADALQSAHELGIVHRDLKPDNIMITQSRGKDVVKVVDFGIAKAMGGEEGQKVTKTGLVVGTPEYMSPEQLSGDVLDGRSDIYSLGLVFFRMVTGTLPFPAESAQETMIKRLTDDPMTLEAAQPGGRYPPGLQGAIDRALQRMPGDRYQHANEFARDVRLTIGNAKEIFAPPTLDTDAKTQLMDAQTAVVDESTTVVDEHATAPAAVTKGFTRQLAPTQTTPAQARPAEVSPTTPATPAPIPSPTTVTKKKTPVVPIAAAVLVVAAAGTTAAVMMTGGSENGASEPVSIQPPLGTDDSTQTLQSAAGDTGGVGSPVATGSETGGTTQASPQLGGEPLVLDTGGTGDSGVAPPATTADPAEVDRELEALLDSINADPQQVRQAAEAHYQDRTLPNSTRAFAAFVVGDSFFAEDRMTEACRWLEVAISLDPTNAVYPNSKTLYRCSP